MRVLFITGSYPPMKCGVGAYTQKLVDALAELEDVNVTVLTDIRARDNSRTDKFDVLPIMNGWGISEIFRIVQHVRQLNPDVVHVQSPTMGYPGRTPFMLSLLLRFLGKPSVQTWHEPVSGAASLWLLVGLKALITVREELLPNLPRLTKKALHRTPTSWIPAACMLPEVVLSNEERLNIRHQHASDDKVLLVYYGFVAPLKGIEILLEIVDVMNVTLLLACDLQNDNSYHRALLRRVNASDFVSRVSVLGFLQDEQLAKYLAAADAVVLPFRDGARECNTTVEGARAQGTFVLTTSLIYSGYNENKNIYYAEPGNVEEMIGAINKYAGRTNKHYVSPLKWDDVAEQHHCIYQKLVSI